MHREVRDGVDEYAITGDHRNLQRLMDMSVCCTLQPTVNYVFHFRMDVHATRF